MAYEYGSFSARFELAGQPEGFSGYYARVWQKTDGHWKVVLHFMRPSETADGKELQFTPKP
jgi:hypothetical protein